MSPARIPAYVIFGATSAGKRAYSSVFSSGARAPSGARQRFRVGEFRRRARSLGRKLTAAHTIVLRGRRRRRTRAARDALARLGYAEKGVLDETEAVELGRL